MITQSYVDGLTRQVFIRDYILNGLFPCQSDIVRSIRSQKREWQFNDKFEYRMLLATTNTGGTLNSQVFNRDVSLMKPGSLDYGIFKATYGTISDGFSVDLTANLETKQTKAAFVSDYATQLHSMRVNVASLFKNFAIHGRYGWLHQLSDADVAAAGTPAPGVPFTLVVPINVFVSGFKKGKFLIKTTGPTGSAAMFPWGPANVSELYMIVDNQPKRLTLQLVAGATPTAWVTGQHLEVAGNRTVQQGTGSFLWNSDGSWGGTGAYTSGAAAGTGAMEGIADLFPWYDLAGDRSAALALPFRDQANRNQYSTEQAGGWVYQETGESIIDAIMRGINLTTATVPFAEIGVWMNPDTRQAIGYQEADSVKVIRELVSAGPVIWQRGTTSTSYSVSSKVIPDVLSDYNLPTNVIIIGPKNDLSYNAWGNTLAKIDEFIHETFGKQPDPKMENLAVPEEFATRLDLGSRITYGSPTLGDGLTVTGIQGGNFVHPSNRLPIAIHEMGALFTEYPYTYSIVKLQAPIIEPSKA